MNVTIERKKTVDCNNATTKGWQRDGTGTQQGKCNLSSGKVDVFYYGPSATKIDGKQYQHQQHQKISVFQPHIMDVYESSGYDYCNDSTKTIIKNDQQVSHQRCISSSSKRKLPVKTTSTTVMGTTFAATTLSNSSSNSISSTLRHHIDFSRALHTDVSLVPPIRQTASIFKQPVTVYKTQESKVKSDIKHGVTQEKPKQLFWEKRLGGLYACDMTGNEFNSLDLPTGIKPIGPNINEQTLLQSIATALHVSNQPVIGQTVSKAVLTSNSGVFLIPEQPLMQSVTITDDDIRRQEDRVNLARRRLQDVLKG